MTSRERRGALALAIVAIAAAIVCIWLRGGFSTDVPATEPRIQTSVATDSITPERTAPTPRRRAAKRKPHRAPKSAPDRSHRDERIN